MSTPPAPKLLLKGLFYLSNFFPDVSYYQVDTKVMGTLKNTEECLPACSFIWEKSVSYFRKKEEKKEPGMNVVGKRVILEKRNLGCEGS